MAAILATVLVTFCADIAAVFDQSGLRIGLLPEVQKRGSLEFVKKRVIFRLLARTGLAPQLAAIRAARPE